nr:hypothetical protein [Tanacetum cinerariifolium]
MSRDVLTVGSTMRIPLLYRGEYSQWVEMFMNYLEEQMDGEAMINSIKNGDQPLTRVTQVSIAGTTSTEQPPLKDKSMWSDQEKRVQKIDRLARSLLIQGLLNDIYSLIDNNKTAKDLWDALVRHMLDSKYGEQDRKAAVLYEYETFKATEGELLLDTYIRYLQVINDLKKCGYSKDNWELNFKFLNNLQPLVSYGINSRFRPWDNKELTVCPTCGISRWKVDNKTHNVYVNIPAKTGVDTYDASTKENINLHAVVFWTINDYLALGTLCGCPYSGFKGCVVCGKDTHCVTLSALSKQNYAGHRRYLPYNHPFRRQKKAFNRQQEFQFASNPLTGEQIYNEVQHIENK